MRRMLSINEKIKEIKVTEDMYDEENEHYEITFEDVNTPQKYLINAEDVEHEDVTLNFEFNGRVIFVKGILASFDDEINGLTVGYGNEYESFISFYPFRSLSISIFNGVVVIDADYFDI